MIWLQTFAVLALAGISQAYNFFGYAGEAEEFTLQAEYRSGIKEDQNLYTVYYEINSFPYYHLPHGAPNEELYVSSVVSLSSGPLCSGFHIKGTVVVTAASCVFKETAKDLVVISHNDKNCLGPPLSFLPVEKVVKHPRYNCTTNEHNVAVLLVHNTTSVPVLRLPMLSLQPETISDVLMAKFAMDDRVISKFSVNIPVNADVNTKMCTKGIYEVNSFLCVSRVDNQPYSYGIADLGTPLILKSVTGDFLNGIYGGHVYNKPQTYHLYQNVYPNLAFLDSFMSK